MYLRLSLICLLSSLLFKEVSFSQCKCNDSLDKFLISSKSISDDQIDSLEICFSNSYDTLNSCFANLLYRKAREQRNDFDEESIHNYKRSINIHNKLQSDFLNTPSYLKSFKGLFDIYFRKPEFIDHKEYKGYLSDFFSLTSLNKKYYNDEFIVLNWLIKTKPSENFDEKSKFKIVDKYTILFEKNNPNSDITLKMLSDAAFIYRDRLKNYKRAPVFYERAINYAYTMGDSIKISECYYNRCIAVSHMMDKKDTNCLSDLDSALVYAITDSLQNKYLTEKAIIYYTVNCSDCKIKSARLFKTIAYYKAEKYGNSSYEYTNTLNKLHKIYKEISDTEGMNFCDSEKKRISYDLDPLDYRITSINAQQDLSTLVWSTDNGKIFIWNRKSENKLDTSILVHQLGEYIKDVKITSNGKYVISKDDNNRLKAWVKKGIGEWIEITSTLDSKSKELRFSKSNKFNISYCNNDSLKISNDDYDLNYYITDKTIITNPNLLSGAFFNSEKNQIKSFSVNKKGVVKIWEENSSTNILKCTDSLDLRRKPKVYLFSIVNDDSVAKFSSFQLKKRLLSDIKTSNDFQFNKTIDHQLIDKNNLQLNLFDSIHFSFFKNINQNDRVIFHLASSSFSGPLNLDYFIKSTEKLRSNHMLFLTESANENSKSIKNLITNNYNDPYYNKKNNVILSENKDGFVIKSIIQSKMSLLSIFNLNHRERNKFISSLYEVFAEEGPSNHEDFQFRLFFEKDGFELNFNNEKDIIINNDNKIRKKETLCVFVGNNKYDSINPLRTPINDITKIKNVLHEKYNGIKFPNDELWIDLTKDQFSKKLSELQNKFEFQEGSQLLFYFAGHGYSSDQSHPSLLFKDSYKNGIGFSNNFHLTTLTLYFQNLIKKEGLNKVLIVIDACNQDIKEKTWDRINPNKQEYSSKIVNRKLADEHCIVITSTRGNQLALDGYKNSPFCNQLYDILKNNDQWISNHEIFLQLEQLEVNPNHFTTGLTAGDKDYARFFFNPKVN